MRFIANGFEENRVAFNVNFRRCYRMLHFIACRVLGNPDRAKKAVENCWHTASRYSPRFEYEGAFRSWLLRVLLDEALTLLRESQQTAQPKVSCEPVLAEVFWGSGLLGAKSDVRNEGFFHCPGREAADLPAILSSPGSQHKASGTGIGLSVTKRIAETHTGRVWVECDSETSTTFSFALPLIHKEA